MEGAKSDSPSARQPATLLAVVHGRVQGVGFRYFVVERARGLGLVGATRNLRDGTVEVQARGPRGALEKLVQELNAGPPLAHVTHVELVWDLPLGAFEDFDIAQ